MTEALAWLLTLVGLIALWMTTPLALRIFDPLPPDTPPDAFLGLGPPWFYLSLLFNAVATLICLVAALIRVGVVVIGWGRRHFPRNAN